MKPNEQYEQLNSFVVNNENRVYYYIYYYYNNNIYNNKKFEYTQKETVRCSFCSLFGFRYWFRCLRFSLLALLSRVFLQYLTRRHLFLNRFSQATRPWIWSIRKDVVSLHL